ncbi:uncharacterized protein V1516DRAFT_677405 [Lipomyces oligophaga]|uniref:uncharacterized protein n=1 Tax=Lipomyces oligophaga TaxID=45792 RepID=UPI0034CDB2F0
METEHTIETVLQSPRSTVPEVQPPTMSKVEPVLSRLMDPQLIFKKIHAPSNIDTEETQAFKQNVMIGPDQKFSSSELHMLSSLDKSGFDFKTIDRCTIDAADLPINSHSQKLPITDILNEDLKNIANPDEWTPESMTDSSVLSEEFSVIADNTFKKRKLDFDYDFDGPNDSPFAFSQVRNSSYSSPYDADSEFEEDSEDDTSSGSENNYRSDIKNINFLSILGKLKLLQRSSASLDTETQSQNLTGLDIIYTHDTHTESILPLDLADSDLESLSSINSELLGQEDRFGYCSDVQDCKTTSYDADNLYDMIESTSEKPVGKIDARTHLVDQDHSVRKATTLAMPKNSQLINGIQTRRIQIHEPVQADGRADRRRDVSCESNRSSDYKLTDDEEDDVYHPIIQT